MGAKHGQCIQYFVDIVNRSQPKLWAAFFGKVHRSSMKVCLIQLIDFILSKWLNGVNQTKIKPNQTASNRNVTHSRWRQRWNERKINQFCIYFQSIQFFAPTFCSWHIAHLVQRKNCGFFYFWSADERCFFLFPQAKTHFLFPKFNKRVNVFWELLKFVIQFFLRSFSRDKNTVFLCICICLSIWYCDMFWWISCEFGKNTSSDIGLIRRIAM